MPTGAAIGGASLLGSAFAADASKDAAKAAGKGADAGIAEQRRQFDTLLGLTSNQRAIGNQALNALAAVYGYSPADGFANDEYTGDTIGGGRSDVGGLGFGSTDIIRMLDEGMSLDEVLRLGRLTTSGKKLRRYGVSEADLARLRGAYIAPEPRERSAGNVGNALAAPDYSAFFRSPDYMFRMNEGLNAAQGSAAAQGGLYSGNALRGIQQYGQDLAAGEFGNWFNRQAALAGMGQAATNQAGNAALSTGANISSLLAAQGNARASGITGQANAIAGGINDLASIFGIWRAGGFDKPLT